MSHENPCNRLPACFTTVLRSATNNNWQTFRGDNSPLRTTFTEANHFEESVSVVRRYEIVRDDTARTTDSLCRTALGHHRNGRRLRQGVAKRTTHSLGNLQAKPRAINYSSNDRAHFPQENNDLQATLKSQSAYLMGRQIYA